MQNIYEAVSANKRRSAIIVAVFFLFVTLAVYVLAKAFAFYLGYAPGGLGYFGLAFIISGVASFVSYFYSDKIVLGISGARPANRKKDFLFYTVVENLCLGSGLPKPALYVIDDTAPNAFAAGRDPAHAVICATTGLVAKLKRSELEGVIAHELTHIKSFDTRLMSVVSVMVGLVALLGDWFLRLQWLGKKSDRDNEGSLGAIFMVVGIAFALLSPVIAQLIQLAISRRREFSADAGAVAITRQPEGLISALGKISADQEPLEVANKATAHLYIVNPFRGKSRGTVSWFSNLFNTHPPLTERIKLLRAML